MNVRSDTFDVPDQFRFDVWLSYSPTDRTTALQLAKRLKSRSLRVWFDEWELRPGGDMRQQFDSGIDASRKMLFCMSPDAFKPDGIIADVDYILKRDSDNSEHRLIPLLIQDATIPARIDRFVYIDYRNEREAGWKELLSALADSRIPSPTVPDELRNACQAGVLAVCWGWAKRAGRVTGLGWVCRRPVGLGDKPRTLGLENRRGSTRGT